MKIFSMRLVHDAKITLQVSFKKAILSPVGYGSWGVRGLQKGERIFRFTLPFGHWSFFAKLTIDYWWPDRTPHIEQLQKQVDGLVKKKVAAHGRILAYQVKLEKADRALRMSESIFDDMDSIHWNDDSEWQHSSYSDGADLVRKTLSEISPDTTISEETNG